MAADGNTVSGNGREERKGGVTASVKEIRRGKCMQRLRTEYCFHIVRLQSKSQLGPMTLACIHRGLTVACIRADITCMRESGCIASSIKHQASKHQASSINFSDADLMQKLHPHWI